MTDPQPDFWGPVLIATARSILTDLTNGITDRAASVTHATTAGPAARATATNLIRELGHLGVIDRADPRTLRLTVLGRPWADTWLQDHR